MTTARKGCEGSASRPGRSLPPEKTRYPLYRRLGGPQGWYGQVQKISPPPGFDPRTVQPVVSRYNDYATRPTRTGDTEFHFLRPYTWTKYLPSAMFIFVYFHQKTNEQSCVCNVTTRRRWEANFMPQLLYSWGEILQYPLNIKLEESQSWYG
jgi:hypothetical protein